MSFHAEVLGRTQAKALRQLAPLMTQRGFYLAGGTALALHLGHRRSVDLDWFTAVRIDDPLRLAQELRSEGAPFVTEFVERGTLYGSVFTVRMSALEYQYPLLEACVPWPEVGCLIASLDDIACMKLSAIAQRGAKKDFVDIYALGRNHRPLSELLRLYERKYSIENISHLLRSYAVGPVPSPSCAWREAGSVLNCVTPTPV